MTVKAKAVGRVTADQKYFLLPASSYVKDAEANIKLLLLTLTSLAERARVVSRLID